MNKKNIVLKINLICVMIYKHYNLHFQFSLRCRLDLFLKFEAYKTYNQMNNMLSYFIIIIYKLFCFI